MKTQHTPGPWRIVNRFDEQKAWNGRRITLEGASGMIADLDWNSPQENLANANLIAAAPELLAALQITLEALNSAKIDTGISFEFAAKIGDARGKAKLAIAKAKGEA